MRILHISNDYYNSGVYQTLHSGFLKNGLDSVFFVPMRADAPKQNGPNVMEAHCFHSRDRYFYMNKQRRIYRQFREAVRLQKPDLTHGYFLFSGGIHCLWAKREFGIPYVITVQNTDINTIYRYFIHLRGLAWEILREAETVFFVSDAYRTFTLEHMVPPKARETVAEKFRVLAFAVDPFWTEHTDVSAHDPHDGPVRLLTVGVVNAEKNQLRAVEAAKILQEQGMDVELTVIGGTGDEKIDQQIRSCDLVRRIDKIPREQLIGEYRRADLFVLPSLRESFGLVYAEALTQGLPVLYSAGQGFDKQFDEGYIGYRVDARDPQHIAACVRKALETYDILQGNCAGAAAKFTRQAVCEASEAHYRRIVSAHGHKAM